MSYCDSNSLNSGSAADWGNCGVAKKLDVGAFGAGVSGNGESGSKRSSSGWGEERVGDVETMVELELAASGGAILISERM